MIALFVNCTLKKGNEPSNTRALMDKVEKEMKTLGVTEVKHIRLANENIALGTEKDMGDGDGWPAVLEEVKRADILVLGTPIWLGQVCSVAQQFMERMDAIFHDKSLSDDETGQYFTYNKVAGVVITGNQDGAQHVSQYVLWALQDMGYTIPPNVTCFWHGGADGPGDYLDNDGEKSLYANRTARYTAHNLVAVAKALKNTPIPTKLKKLDEEAEAVSETGAAAANS